MESTRYTGAVRLPLEATIVERNLALVERPRLLNDCPLRATAGWSGSVPRAPPVPPSLETAEAIAARLTERIRDRRIRCWPQTPDLELYEIGIECSAVLTMLNEELRVARRHGSPARDGRPDQPDRDGAVVGPDGHALLAHRREGNLHQFLVRKEAHPMPRETTGS